MSDQLLDGCGDHFDPFERKIRKPRTDTNNKSPFSVGMPNVLMRMNYSSELARFTHARNQLISPKFTRANTMEDS